MTLSVRFQDNQTTFFSHYANILQVVWTRCSLLYCNYLRTRLSERIEMAAVKATGREEVNLRSGDISTRLGGNLIRPLMAWTVLTDSDDNNHFFRGWDRRKNGRNFVVRNEWNPFFNLQTDPLIRFNYDNCFPVIYYNVVPWQSFRDQIISFEKSNISSLLWVVKRLVRSII